MAIRDVLMRGDLALTPSEEKIVKLLLTDYPTSGLGTATSLARRAGVSDPTVIRLVMKLGFDGFADFQARLLAEIESRLHSPLLMMEAKRADQAAASADQAVVITYIQSVINALDKAMTTTPVTTYDRAARIIMEAKGQVMFLGGRFSRHVAGMLASYIYQFRSGVVDMGTLSAQRFDILADMGKRDVLVVFDYRRYQLDVVAFAKQAAARGVKIVLFTDPWLSPVSEYAEATIVSPQEVTSPYDTLGPSIVQMEALVTHILSTISEATHDRIEALEEVRRQNTVTLDSVRDNGRNILDEEPGMRDFPGPKAR